MLNEKICRYIIQHIFFAMLFTDNIFIRQCINITTVSREKSNCETCISINDLRKTCRHFVSKCTDRTSDISYKVRRPSDALS